MYVKTCVVNSIFGNLDCEATSFNCWLNASFDREISYSQNTLIYRFSMDIYRSFTVLVTVFII